MYKRLLSIHVSINMSMSFLIVVTFSKQHRVIKARLSDLRVRVTFKVGFLLTKRDVVSLDKRPEPQV